jgi:class 3 adenylate cyclase
LYYSQWGYNVWAVQNQSNATLYEVTSRMQGLAGIYPAVLSSSPNSSSQPFVTLPQFELYGQAIRQQNQVLFVSYSPFITNELNRTSWERYSVENQGWIEESFAYVGGSAGAAASLTDPAPILEYIWYYNDKGTQDRVPADEAPYAPSWQSSPPPTDPRGIVNQDFTQNDQLAPLTAYINQGATPILSAPLNVDSVYGQGVVPGAANDVGTTSVLMVPVYDVLTHAPASDGVINGFVSGVVPWSTFFENILPDRVVGFQIVVESCGTVNNTFELNGANVTFVGQGDLHDPEFDAYVEVSTFANFGVQPGTFDNACPHTLYMFRTDEWQAQFKNVERETLVLTITILCTFILIALGFAVYEYFLRLRFKNRFILANDIYFEENGGGGGGGSALLQANRVSAAAAAKNRTLSRGGDFGESLTAPSGKAFQETTILFADVVGLEEWSSVRDPSEVFALLEALYGSFDAIAMRSDVYKVDTFGDNYVAVCGAPVANRDHPFVMCQFARECLQESKEVFRDLSKRLGKDTKDLAVRFGLNSGPVTASIVQGEVGQRLQLFGDSVSTANFIKNTGTKNMIHLTEQTANLLISSGRRNLVTEVRGHARARAGRVSSRQSIDLKTDQYAFLCFVTA